MGDTVRYLMEEMIPELEELEKKGYFSRSEIKQIVLKRQDFEYHLKRRAAMKKDFLRYIDYESKLEELRRHRKKALGIKGKKGPAEVGIIRRIHFIFDRATRKFKADLSLWVDWLKYCKQSKSSKQFSKVVTKALHRHSHVAALWIEAAAWEFEHNGHVAAARALMQQGLRHCRTDEGLWGEYLRMELLYVARLRARRDVLGLPNPQTPEDIAQLLQAHKTPGKRKRGAAEAADGGADPEAAEAAVRAVLTGAVARVVIKGAAQALPASVALRRRFLAVLAQFDFPGIAELRDAVYDNLAADFAADESAWDLCARRHWLQGGLQELPADSSQEEPAAGREGVLVAAEPSTSGATFDEAAHRQCCDVYQAALQAAPTTRMYALYAAYMGKRTALLLAAAAAGSDHAVEAAATVGAELLALHHQAFESGHSSQELCGQWVRWALRLSQPKVALRAARRACERWPASAAAWSSRLQLELQLHSRRQRSADELFSTLQAGLTAVSACEGAELWSLALQAVQPGDKDWGRLLDTLYLSLAPGPRGPVSGGMGAVTAGLVARVHEVQGADAARALYSRLLSVPPAGCDLFKAAIKVEQQEQLAAAGSSGRGTAGAGARREGEARMRKLYEAAVDAYGSEDVELWLQYASFEQSALKGVGDIYWRATKALSDPDAFIELYRQSQLGSA
mmetsp:Transcript_22822/g.58091  ORF Transcript_22822/g.58091 Transcript_22822/m.58091 type:complete len:681 (-) Transcript_22822:163-2205(-)|eukprot:CAMPEP_0202857898 /NCGR_PEP_ID=MMETSP1391-20130828/659_1 /ASSEMBLY_ACC=CAM_ASM_000867 /TAXON_ID=1034604 /ORGANISM="Chlamydomonas leiostraca, Strain SAG 11-49" /LENGTH=680 /DNA_ID=CAMNT_0049536761 /DNA_START=221 /DNA_END=2263 /DNA_ORIENTATION=+